MPLHTFQARSLAEALRLVREELGPDASVLHTREVGSTLARFFGVRIIEVTASAELSAPSRLPPLAHEEPLTDSVVNDGVDSGRIPAAELQDFRRKFREDLLVADEAEDSLVEQLSASRTPTASNRSAGGAITDQLRAAGVSGATVRRWLDRVEAELACDPECHADRKQERLKQIIAGELAAVVFPNPGSRF
jgi:flagellar biosynthesis protein FlhF